MRSRRTGRRIVGTRLPVEVERRPRAAVHGAFPVRERFLYEIGTGRKGRLHGTALKYTLIYGRRDLYSRVRLS